MLSKYSVILFDSDNTIYNHAIHEKAAIFEVLKTCGFPQLDEYYFIYRDVNADVWKEFEGGIRHEDGHLIERFRRFLSVSGLNACPFELNKLYIDALSNQCSPFPESDAVLAAISKTHKLYIVTNGTESIQHKRYYSSPLLPYLSGIFTADGIGTPKPNAEFFEHVLKSIGNPDPSKVIVIGDSLTSDILGGINAGLDTCWFNPEHKKHPLDISPTYEINKLTELIS